LIAGAELLVVLLLLLLLLLVPPTSLPIAAADCTVKKTEQNPSRCAG